MRAKDIHAAVEALVGEPVAWSSVKMALASNAAGPSRRFVRVARGRYVLAATASPGLSGADNRSSIEPLEPGILGPSGQETGHTAGKRCPATRIKESHLRYATDTKGFDPGSSPGRESSSW